MRIVQVVTMVASDGAFGGPVSVAIAQCAELARQGHSVTLLAGWDGHAQLRIPGVRVVLARTKRVPGTGFIGTWSPAAVRWLRKHRSEVDLVHVHAGRHLLDMDVALAASHLGLPYVLQTHGMVMPSSSPIVWAFDRWRTRRVVAGARALLSLTVEEDGGLERLFPTASVHRVRNGVAAPPPGRRTASTVPEVLFLARLHPRKRVLAFARMADLLHRRGIDAHFTVVGPDEGDLTSLRAFIAERPELPLQYEGDVPPGDGPRRLSQAAVYVLPSVGEVFPMTVLEALAAGTPSVITNECGIAGELAEYDAAVVTSPEPGALADGVLSVLTDAERAEQLTAAGRAAIETRYGIDAVAADLSQLYARVAPGPTKPSVIWVTNSAPPYRLPVWEALSRDTDLEVWLLESDDRLRSDSNNRGDDWAVGRGSRNYRIRFLDTAVVKRGEARHYVCGWLSARHFAGRDAILIGGWDSPAYWVAAWCAGRAGLRRVGFYESTLLSQRFARGPIAWARRRFYRMMDAVVVPGVAARDALLHEGVDPRRIVVGFNAVDVETIHEEANRVRAALPPPEGPQHLRALVVGQLIDRKNVAAAIGAIVAPELEHVTLTIVGGGKAERDLRDQVKRLGLNDRVRFAGYVPGTELPSLLATHDLLLHPALEEVWGLVVNEALAAGLPVIVSNRAGVAPSIEDMVGVRIIRPTEEAIRKALVEARPTVVDRPPILMETPERFAAVFRSALLSD
ncbi:glycosyltransferase [Curtobacterium sp. MCBD17_035]|uniref:glycosyltransferase n=1 Tax=Curtobacterium sp. MCBD17_035 TaxID=2175673 RepID=UPI000DA97A7D|nr:glycosyltransferase [Curtobacterium sp. MCBD17_035]WIB67971.1 glycosyltransferase [Curtobacterium sp. MCBD17_035]